MQSLDKDPHGSNSWIPVEPIFGYGYPPDSGWRRVANHRSLIILVGTTAVGKGTVITLTRQQLEQHNQKTLLLPNRRQLTDKIILMDKPITCRLQRMKLTQQFRERVAGGMASILDHLWIQVSNTDPSILIFDGLRGESEVSYAIAALPNARFVLLEAPAVTRLQRLLKRQDQFDMVTTIPETEQDTDLFPESFDQLNVGAVDHLFSSFEQKQLLKWAQDESILKSNLVSKIQILLEESQNYNTETTKQTLLDLASSRTLVVDTSQVSSVEASNLIGQFIQLVTT
ncbi:MAG: hypothetical protein NW237_08275 [Cyanobacteriota bacterium]|nr:hypothetical protein [Cyanobacteriota bacterium]